MTIAYLSEIEKVLEMYNNECQDVDVIAERLNINVMTVSNIILDELKYKMNNVA